MTIGEALTQRSPDFPGVVVCTAGDSLGTLLQLIKIRRVHRLVVVEGEVCRLRRPPMSGSVLITTELGGGETRGQKGSPAWCDFAERRVEISDRRPGHSRGTGTT
jgi:hypothetical protein